MNLTPILFVLACTLTALILWLSIIRFLLCRLRPEAESDGRFKPAYGLYFSGLLVAGFFSLSNAIRDFAETALLILKLYPDTLIPELLRQALIDIGLSLAWLLFCFIVSRAFIAAITGISKETNEMKLGNTYYFLIKVTLFTGLAWLTDPLLLSLLKLYHPQLPVPFIH